MELNELCFGLRKQRKLLGGRGLRGIQLAKCSTKAQGNNKRSVLCGKTIVANGLSEKTSEMLPACRACRAVPSRPALRAVRQVPGRPSRRSGPVDLHDTKCWIRRDDDQCLDIWADYWQPAISTRLDARQSAQVSPSPAPTVGSHSPGGPGGPGGPSIMPVVIESPLICVVMPRSPLSPLSPFGPAAPTSPAGPAGPASPGGPGSPGGPATPAGPG